MGCSSSKAKPTTVHPVMNSPTVSAEQGDEEAVANLRGKLRSLGIPVGGTKTKTELEKLLAAFEKPLVVTQSEKPPLEPLGSSSSSSSSSPSPATKRRASFGAISSLSPSPSKLLRRWLEKARTRLRPPELPRLPPATSGLVTARVPQHMKVQTSGAATGRPTFFDALKDERQNQINTQTVRVQLSRALPDQAKPKTQLPNTLAAGTPGFGKATPGFGASSAGGNISASPFHANDLPAMPSPPFNEEEESATLNGGGGELAGTPQPTPRSETTSRNGDEVSEAYPSSPEAKSARGASMGKALAEGTNFTVGGFEFCAGETVEWGKKRGVVVGISKDCRDVRVRYEADGRLLKIPPDRLVRVEVRIGKLFDIFNNSSVD